MDNGSTHNSTTCRHEAFSIFASRQQRWQFFVAQMLAVLFQVDEGSWFHSFVFFKQKRTCKERMTYKLNQVDKYLVQMGWNWNHDGHEPSKKNKFMKCITSMFMIVFLYLFYNYWTSKETDLWNILHLYLCIFICVLCCIKVLFSYTYIFLSFISLYHTYSIEIWYNI